MVGHQTLTLGILVRVQASQPNSSHLVLTILLNLWGNSIALSVVMEDTTELQPVGCLVDCCRQTISNDRESK